MNSLMLVMRLLHIFAGTFWVGTAIFNRFFLLPAVGAAGEAGQSVLKQLTTKAKATVYLTIAGYVVLATGAVQYWIDSRGFTSAWQTSGPGIAFGLGGIAGILGFGFGQVVGKNAKRLGELAAQIQGRPSAEQAAALDAARRAMESGSTISTVLLIAALVLMATARYWIF